nr:F-box only protein 13 [Solanum lycopersicum]
MASKRNLKRKLLDQHLVFPLDELNQDLLERVLSWLPTSTFLRLTSVSKRWKSAANSPVFHHACSQIPSREPWFYMVDSSQSSEIKNQQQFVYDAAEMNWKFLTYPSNFIGEKKLNQSNFLPVAASGGLLCFHNGENDSWEDTAILSKKSPTCPAAQFCTTDDDDDDRMLYFLSKCGNVVATEIQKNPCKQYSSITTTTKGDRQEILCFLNSSGKVVACNLTEKHFFEYPRLLPLHHEYSIDLVECGGELLAVVLSEFLETASLRIWKFDEKEWAWNQVLTMPSAISHEFYSKKVDINCTGSSEHMFVCISNSGSSDDESCRYFLCKLAENEWTELPACSGKFSCAFSFQPRIEASV